MQRELLFDVHVSRMGRAAGNITRDPMASWFGITGADHSCARPFISSRIRPSQLVEPDGLGKVFPHTDQGGNTVYLIENFLKVTNRKEGELFLLNSV